MKYKSFTLSLLAVLLMYAAHCQTFEKSLDISKAFPMKNMTTIQVENKYGNINIVPWEKDSVKFDIHLEVTSSKMDRLDKSFKSIDFDFTANDYFISARTVFKNQKNKWIAEITDMATSLFNSSNAQIDYTVYLPKNAEISIDNKFGNVYTTNLDGKITFNISNGDMRANDLTGDVRIDLEFGDFNVHQISNGALEFNYANATIDQSDKIMIESRSSEIEIENVAEIELQSRRDKISIRNLNRITGSLSFSDVELSMLNNEMIVKSEYGGIEIDKLSEAFNLIDLSSNYTDISLMVSKDAGFDFELIHTKESDVTVSGFVEIVNTEVLNKEDGVIKVTGHQGNTNKSGSRIRIDLKSGSFKII